MAYNGTETAAPNTTTPYSDTKKAFTQYVRSEFKELSGEIEDRNARITSRDDYIYGDKLEKALDIPIGHDFTPVNWLRRTVEIHKNMFMSRGFQVVSSYDTKNPEQAQDDNDKGRIEIENTKRKEYAEQRMNTCEAIIQDNGGYAQWGVLAENASAIGDACVKAWYDEDKEKYVINQIESVENIYVLWNKDDFREYDAVAYVYQVSKQKAITDFNAPDDVSTSPLGQPMEVMAASTTTSNTTYTQPMVTIMEVTGKICGYGSKNGQITQVKEGEETTINATIVGSDVTRLIDEAKRIPKYYILPNKRQRRRAWGQSDVSDAAININLTYIETLSDWRTVSSKVNFPKYKGYGFGPDSQLPKSEPRKIQVLPLADGQDMQRLDQGDTNQLDFKSQMDELKEQFVRETGISRVLFDDPTVTFNSNQALLTSMKPTSDIAEAKKQLWSPIIVDIFEDALETLALYQPDVYGDLVDTEENWTLKVMWPSVMQKEDPVFQNMLLNRFNAGTMSLQSYLEQQGESKEEIDRLRDELTDPITSAILGKQLPLISQIIVNAATAELQSFYQASLPQTQIAQQQADQQGAEAAANAGGQGTPGINDNGGAAIPGQVAVPGQNQPGQQPISQPGSGASGTTPAGAVAQVAQTSGV
jgi:hypothetical protein